MLNNIYIHNITYVILFLSFLAGYFEYVFLLLIIIIIHEFGHYFGAMIMKFKSSKIEIFPFGGITTNEELLNVSIKKELVVLLLGPIFQILFYLLITFLYRNHLVFEHTYMNFKNINYLLLNFNLLPIIPLDGSKLFFLILNYFIPYKKSLNISIIVSIIALLFLIICEKNILIIIISLILIKEIINIIKSKEKILNKFLLERYLYFFNFKIGKNINTIYKIKRNRTHNIICNNKIYSEKEYLRKYFDK